MQLFVVANRDPPRSLTIKSVSMHYYPNTRVRARSVLLPVVAYPCMCVFNAFVSVWCVTLSYHGCVCIVHVHARTLECSLAYQNPKHARAYQNSDILQRFACAQYKYT